MRIDPAVTESATLAWSAKIKELKAKGRPILSLGLGEPDYPTPPHVIAAAEKAMRDGYTRYSTAPGLDELRSAGARKLKAENGVDAKASEVLITPGAKNALFLAAAALLEPGDEAVVLSPGWVSDVPIMKLAEASAKVVDVPLKGPDYSFDKDLIGAALTKRSKVLLVNYPNNPTGRMLSKAEADALVSLMREHPGLHLISDEIYESLALGGLESFSPASVADLRDRIVTVNGFSKAHSMTGWRIGYAHAPAPVFAKMLKIHGQLNSHAAPFVQKAALAALEGTQEHRSAFLARLKANKAVYERFLSACPTVKGSRAEGGFFAFLDVSGAKLKSDAFAAELLEKTGVAVLPGLQFGAAFDQHCRISLATPAAEFEKALEKIGEFVTEKAK